MDRRSTAGRRFLWLAKPAVTKHAVPPDQLTLLADHGGP